MYGLVDAHRHTHGVEPICKVLQIAPSAYRRYAARRRNASMLSARAKRDKALQPRIEQVWNANLRVYGADKVASAAAPHCGDCRFHRTGVVEHLALVVQAGADTKINIQPESLAPPTHENRRSPRGAAPETPLIGRYEAGSVIDCVVARHDDRNPLTSLRFADGELRVPRVDLAAGTPVWPG